MYGQGVLGEPSILGEVGFLADDYVHHELRIFEPESALFSTVLDHLNLVPVRGKIMDLSHNVCRNRDIRILSKESDVLPNFQVLGNYTQDTLTKFIKLLWNGAAFLIGHLTQTDELIFVDVDDELMHGRILVLVSSIHVRDYSGMGTWRLFSLRISSSTTTDAEPRKRIS